MTAPARHRSVLWFRRDLRLDDLPAANRAAALGPGGVVPLFVVDPWLVARTGPNRRRFLKGCIEALGHALGGQLVVRVGDPAVVVRDVSREARASAVVVTEDAAPVGRRRDREVAAALRDDSRRLVAAGTNYAVPPGTVRGRSGRPIGVFTPFRNAWLPLAGEAPAPAVQVRWLTMRSDAGALDVLLDDAAARGRLPSAWEGLPLEAAAALPPAGAPAAHDRLEAFVERSLASYANGRDQLGVDGTSRLSPYLRFGCIHPRTVLAKLGDDPGHVRFRDELCWREFFADLAFHHPESLRRPLQAFGEHLDVDRDASAAMRFRHWATGTTGYDLVDAAMRQLLREGWMHNRARMVAASFLVKDLHLDWRAGARWFLWHLVDGDVASNQHGWQWVAGTGADAAPFHRIFNPDRQRERFDPNGAYLDRYLAGADPRDQIVDHAVERRVALARFATARAAARPTG